MKAKSTLILDDEFIQYCSLNNIIDSNKLAKETFNRGFSLLKYGETPKGNSVKEITVAKEVIKEVIKEVEVEKIVYIDKIVEKPIEIIKEIIKEVPVEVIREVIKEIPIEIEVIREVEKIVEVPIEVVKEVPIYKEGKSKTKTVVKEVPVEVIKEVIKIKEVPVEVIKEVIKEVPIEKIIEVTKEVINTEELQKLKTENESLKRQLDNITDSLNKFSKASFIKRNNNSNLYDE